MKKIITLLLAFLIAAALVACGGTAGTSSDEADGSSKADAVSDNSAPEQSEPEQSEPEQSEPEQSEPEQSGDESEDEPAPKREPFAGFVDFIDAEGNIADIEFYDDDTLIVLYCDNAKADDGTYHTNAKIYDINEKKLVGTQTFDIGICSCINVGDDGSILYWSRDGGYALFDGVDSETPSKSRYNLIIYDQGIYDPDPDFVEDYYFCDTDKYIKSVGRKLYLYGLGDEEADDDKSFLVSLDGKIEYVFVGGYYDGVVYVEVAPTICAYDLSAKKLEVYTHDFTSDMTHTYGARIFERSYAEGGRVNTYELGDTEKVGIELESKDEYVIRGDNEHLFTEDSSDKNSVVVRAYGLDGTLYAREKIDKQTDNDGFFYIAHSAYRGDVQIYVVNNPADSGAMVDNDYSVYMIINDFTVPVE